MGKKKLAALMAVLLISVLVACTAQDSGVINTGEMEGDEKSSADLLVDTLEYLLIDDDTSDESDGVFQIKDDESNQDTEEASDQIEVTIYYGNGASDKLNTEISPMDQLSAENLVDALAVHNIVSLGTKVNSFEEKENNGNKVLYLDLDKAFREYLKTMNNESEKIILASLTATFLEAYDAQSIVITVNGKVLETNNGTYEEPFGYSNEYIEAAPSNE